MPQQHVHVYDQDLGDRRKADGTLVTVKGCACGATIEQGPGG
jgi:hypothetical protein